MPAASSNVLFWVIVIEPSEAVSMRPRTTLPASLLAGLALLLGVLLPAAALAETRLLDRIVALVNDDVILQSELEEEMALVREQLRQRDERVPRESVLRDRILDQLIMDRLQLQRARNFGIQADDETVNRALRDLARNNDTDLTGLRERFAEEGIDFAQVRADIRQQIMLRQLRQRAVASQISIADEDIERFIERMERAQDRDAEYRLHHILLSAPNSATNEEIAAMRERAEALVEDLRAGEDFARVAAEISDGPEALSGGDLGWRPPQRLPALFLDAVEDMEPGDISEPLESANGYHILRLTDQRGGVSRTVTEIRARHILIRVGGDGGLDDETARERLGNLRRRIAAGASFAELASGHSDDAGTARAGGDLGWFGPGEMTPVFQDVVEELAPGELSQPFRTRFGWHLVEVQDRREREDAESYRRAQARRSLFQQRLEEETQRWLSELRDEAFIEKRLDS